MGSTTTRSTRTPGCRSATRAPMSPDRGDERRAVGNIERDAADVTVVRDLGRKNLDRDRIGEGQGRCLRNAGIERDRRRPRDAEAIEQRTGRQLVEGRAAFL